MKETRYPWWKFTWFNKQDNQKSHDIRCDFVIWYNKTFFVSNIGIRRLRKELFPSTEKVIKHDD